MHTVKVTHADKMQADTRADVLSATEQLSPLPFSPPSFHPLLICLPPSTAMHACPASSADPQLSEIDMSSHSVRTLYHSMLIFFSGGVQIYSELAKPVIADRTVHIQ